MLAEKNKNKTKVEKFSITRGNKLIIGSGEATLKKISEYDYTT